MNWPFILLAFSNLTLLGFLLPGNLLAQEAPKQSNEVFKRYASRVAQVQVIENNSLTKSTIGSAFFVNAEGNLITNYHVISDIIYHPDKFSIKLIFNNGDQQDATLSDFDVVNDLALLLSEEKSPNFLSLSDSDPIKGEKLFSLGNPHDIGFSIVEGIYNGLVTNSETEKIHFTGAINSGMSGGPALRSSGEVVGVNVQKGGDDIGFLVSRKYVAKLLLSKRKLNSNEYFHELDRQLVAHQEQVVHRIVSNPRSKLKVGSYHVPTKIGPSLKCWSSSDEPAGHWYKYYWHSCENDEYVYLKDSHQTSKIRLAFTSYQSDKLNPFQFSNLIESVSSRWGRSRSIGDSYYSDENREEDLTNYDCREAFVNTNNSRQLVQMCMRAYRRLPSLRDITLISVSRDDDTEALVGYLTLFGVTAESGRKLVSLYLGEIQWKSGQL